MKNILVTGCAGFIGYHVTKRLLTDGHRVIGIDNLNEYYDSGLKRDRLQELRKLPVVHKPDFYEIDGNAEAEMFTFYYLDLTDEKLLKVACKDEQFDIIIHLAAMPGVAYSATNPRVYLEDNVNGFFNILEICAEQNKTYPVKLLFASSSSVYGNEEGGCRECLCSNEPLSFYAATKKTNELMAHSYSHLHGFTAIGMRFFTVYGPWGRPDMAGIKFADAIMNDTVIHLHDGASRDFTYIDDTVDGIIHLMFLASHGGVYNVGTQEETRVETFVSLLEEMIGKKANIVIVPLPAGMPRRTLSDNWKIHRETGYVATMTLREGIIKFAEWYKSKGVKGKK